MLDEIVNRGEGRKPERDAGSVADRMPNQLPEQSCEEKREFSILVENTQHRRTRTIFIRGKVEGYTVLA